MLGAKEIHNDILFVHTHSYVLASSYVSACAARHAFAATSSSAVSDGSTGADAIRVRLPKRNSYSSAAQGTLPYCTKLVTCEA